MPSFLDLPRAANCEARSLVGERDGKILIIPLRCNSWGCIRCAARKTTVWAHRVSDAQPERMITFTKLDASRADIKLSFQQIIRDLRKEKLIVEYWGVVELHKSGEPHMHVVQRGSFIPKKLLLSIAQKHGWGWTDVRAITQGWSAARYCAKHLCHSHGRRWPGRLIRYSKKFFYTEVAQGDIKEAIKELKLSVHYGRADELARKFQRRGHEVECGEMGTDWIMGETVIAGEVIHSFVRNEKKGYLDDSLKYSTTTQYDPNLAKRSRRYKDENGLW